MSIVDTNASLTCATNVTIFVGGLLIFLADTLMERMGVENILRVEVPSLADTVKLTLRVNRP